MKKVKQREKAKRVYVTPNVTCIPIDHEISLVMMSAGESQTPPPENIGLFFNPIKFLR